VGALGQGAGSLMPRPDLLPVRNRLAWALLHASRLKEQVDTWADEALVVERTTDPKTGRIIHRARVTTDPPVDVPLGLSDSLHQARSTLDNLVGVLRGGATTSSGYPVARTPAAFEQQARSALQGVPPWAISVIRRLQPFGTDGWRFIGDGLIRLHDLARADRHRALLLQVGVIDIDKVYIGTAEGAETQFSLSRDLRTMTVETSDPRAEPHFGATVEVSESILRYPEYPFYPDVTDVAMQTITAVKGVIDMIERVAAEQPDETE
jgi:hypothetical protein